MFGEVSPLELRKLIEAGRKIVLLDVRERWEFAIVSLPGALLIPLGEIPKRLKEIDSSAEVVVYCHHGVRSARACSFLERSGRSAVMNLTGGIDAYADVDPVIVRY